MPTPLEFYFDFISPNAYLAWQRVRDLAEGHGRKLILKPVLFAGLLQAHGQVGPAEVAPKMQWMVRNCLRKATHLGINLVPPHSHPFNPLLPLRVTLVCPAADRVQLTDALFRATWAESRDVADTAIVAGVIRECGLDADKLIQAAGSEVIKSRLRQETESSVSRGVFGVPTMIVDETLFFGFDELPWLERFLSGQDILDKRKYADWLTIQASAWRKKQ